MNALVRLAWRNLGRNRRRTVITGSALAVGVALSVASYGLVEGLADGMLRALTRMDLGHIQIHNPAYPSSRSLEDTLPDYERTISDISTNPSILAAAPRVYGFSLISHGSSSTGVQVVGIDPAREIHVTVLHEYLTKGRYLPIEPTPWPRGRTLDNNERALDEALTKAAEEDVLAEIDALETADSDEHTDNLVERPTGSNTANRDDSGLLHSPKPTSSDTTTPRSAPTPVDAGRASERLVKILSPPPEQPPGVIIGASLAKILAVDVGDNIHATGQTVDGNTQDVYFEVIGIFRTSSPVLDRSRMYMHYADTQRFFGIYDQVHEISLISADVMTAETVATTLFQSLEGERQSTVVVRYWGEIRPDIQQMLTMWKASMIVLLAIIFLVAILGVVNTMLMAVYERTRELGMLKAIGMSGRRIVGLIVIETVFLALAASAVGTLLGFGIDLYLVYYGLDYSAYQDVQIAGLGFDPVLYGKITARGLIMPTVVLSVLSFIASFYPAQRAARLQPAEGMRET